MSERSSSGAHRDEADGAHLDADRGPAAACGVSIRLEEQAALEGYVRKTGSAAAPVAENKVRFGDSTIEAAKDAAIGAGTLRPAPARSL